MTQTYVPGYDTETRCRVEKWCEAKIQNKQTPIRSLSHLIIQEPLQHAQIIEGEHPRIWQDLNGNGPR